MKQIDIDSGKYSCKLTDGNELMIFDSKISSGVANFGKSYTIEYDNHSYIVGEEATDYNLELTKNTFHNKILIYTAIALLVDDNDVINLTVGTPIQMFFNKEDKQSYIDNLYNNGDYIRIGINGKNIKFRINNIVIAPETIGSQILDRDSKHKIKGVIDIGGLNINGTIYLNGVPQKDRILTKNMGTHTLVSNLQQELIKNIGEMYEEYLIHDFMVKSNCSIKVKYVIDEFCYGFMDSIIKEMQKHKWNYEDIELEFTGGGSILLKNYISESFCNPNIIEDVYYNVKGYTKFGGVKHGKTNH